MDELVWKIGDATVTRVEESVVPVPLAGLLSATTPEGIERHRSWLAPAFLDEAGNAPLSLHGLVIEADGRRILVDTCIGSRPTPGYEMLSNRESPFLANLDAAGFPASSIDLVLCTHLHFDHVGWNTQRRDGSWVPTFPNARYLFGRQEWEHWDRVGPLDPAVTIDDAVRPIVEAGRADLVETDHRIGESVRLEATPGHTPGHVAVRIASGGQEALITGDATHHPVQWAEPDWHSPADTDPVGSCATRRRLIGEHTGRGTLVIGTHYPPPCAGELIVEDGGTRFRPVL
jgi:glyoxylase-like metal-dependent hydrolase (beta-lactamase superfamily II)